MVKFIETELTMLRQQIDQMWTFVYNQLHLAQEAVLNSDTQSAQQILVREKRVNAFELKIDSDVEDIIALYNPVAIDLRFVLAMLKINSNLERIGDYADGIARFVVSNGTAPLDKKLVEDLKLETMFATALNMLTELQKALNDEDAELATSILSKDDQLDKINLASIGILTLYAEANPSAIRLCLELVGVFRKLERTGDHLTNIAEEIVFYINAKILKHKDNIPDNRKDT